MAVSDKCSSWYNYNKIMCFLVRYSYSTKIIKLKKRLQQQKCNIQRRIHLIVSTQLPKVNWIFEKFPQGSRFVLLVHLHLAATKSYMVQLDEKSMLLRVRITMYLFIQKTLRNGYQQTLKNLHQVKSMLVLLDLDANQTLLYTTDRVSNDTITLSDRSE